MSPVIAQVSATAGAGSSRRNAWSGHAAISVVSPGKDEHGEVKNQDRLRLEEIADGNNAKCQMAIVCDGVTSSSHAAAAAEYLSSQAQVLFQDDGLRRTVAALKELQSRPASIPQTETRQFPRGEVEEVVPKRNSYQTTFVAVCIKRDEPHTAGTISIKAIGCGDCALFIFRENGELYYNNLNLQNEEDPFRHDSLFIPVLPDDYDEENGNVLFEFAAYAEDAQLLLCSDGLYDGFANFKEIRNWLSEYRADLTDPTLRNGHLSKLHANLKRKSADDDIAFIWLYPNCRSTGS